MFLTISLAIINAIIWTLITIRWKNLRKNNLSSISAFGLLCAALPLWIITFGTLFFYNDFITSKEYSISTAIWAILCIGTNLGSLFILKFKALSELGIYRLAISTFVAMAIDIIFFKNTLNLATLLGVILLIFAGFLLPIHKTKLQETLKLSTTLLLLFTISIVGTIQYTAYKNALTIQEIPLLHTMFAQIILYGTFLIISFKSLKNDYKKRILIKSDFIYFGLLIYIFTLIETYLFTELPITLLIALNVLSMLLYQVYDVKNKELKHTWHLYAAAGLSILAIILIQYKNL